MKNKTAQYCDTHSAQKYLRTNIKSRKKIIIYFTTDDPVHKAKKKEIIKRMIFFQTS